MVDSIKRGARALGANLVVLTHAGSVQVIEGDGRGISTSTHEKMSLRGFAIRQDPKPAAPSGADESAEVQHPNVEI